MQLPKLYKQKSKKIMQWWIEYDKKSYTIFHGYLNGKIQDTTTEILSGKNIGKANETSIAEQVELEAKALWTKQRDRKGYSENIKQDKPIMPMLAHKWEDHGKKIVFPAFVQPKLDGTRCLAHINAGIVKLISRQNKPFMGLNHITEALTHLDDMILDGELFTSDLSFRDIISGIKKGGGNEHTSKIEYHVYDVILDKPYKDRLKFIAGLKLKHPIIQVKTVVVGSVGDIKLFHKDCVDVGYEGAMVRDPNGLYECDKRSKSLLKVKHFQDREYIVIGATENKGKLKGTCTFECQAVGATFQVMPDGSQEERAKYWEDWQNGIIKKGDLATIEYFEYTDNTHEVPRFPILKSIRDYE